jgi:predicted HicB family RNase H-like nuclease
MVLNIKDFPDKLHKQAKIQAAIEGTTLKDLIIKALTEYLKRAKKKGGVT